jgi:diguanylate cyclase (GGDEF)-like protein
VGSTDNTPIVLSNRPLSELLSYLPVLLRAQSSRVLAEHVINVAAGLIENLDFSALFLNGEVAPVASGLLVAQSGKRLLAPTRATEILAALPLASFESVNGARIFDPNELPPELAANLNSAQLFVANCGLPVRSFGFLLAGRRSPFSEGEREYLTALASVAAIALDNAMRFDALKEAAHEMELVNNLAVSLAASLNGEELFNSFMTHLSAVVPVDRAELVLPSLNAEQYLVPFSWDSANRKAARNYFRMPVARSPFERAFSRQEIVVGRWENARLTGDLGQASRRYSSQMLVPLIAKKQVAGVLALRTEKSGQYSPDRLRRSLLEKMANLFGMALLNSRLYEEKVVSAEFDTRTGVYNHDYFDREVISQIYKAQRNNYQLGLIMVDFDNLKTINDTWGHLVGDAALRHIANLITRTIRTTDIVARYGGDEFGIILPGCTQLGLELVAEKTRQAIRGTPLVLENGQEVNLTVSIGAAIYPDDATTPRTLFEAADGAMYVAKRNRDSVRIGRDAHLPRISEQDMPNDEVGLEVDADVMRDLSAADYEQFMLWLNSERPGAESKVLRDLNERLQTTRFELIETSKRAVRYEESYWRSLRFVALLVEQREPYLNGGAEKTVRLVEWLGRALGLNEIILKELTTAAWLSNVYRLALPETFWGRPVAFSPTDWEQVRQLPLEVERWLDNYKLNLPLETVQALRHQRENFDGTGYPHRLAGEEILLGARILGIISAIISMNQPRPYRERLSLSDIERVIMEGAGKQYDPALASLLARNLTKLETDFFNLQ